eukprot:6164733-Ditylum_brightwellii.AAC.1
MMPKQMTKQLALVWACHVSVTQNYVSQTVHVATLHATYQCLRGARASPRRTDHIVLPSEGGAGLGLYN